MGSKAENKEQVPPAAAVPAAAKRAKIGSYDDPDTGDLITLEAGQKGSVVETRKNQMTGVETTTVHAALTGKHLRFIGK